MVFYDLFDYYITGATLKSMKASPTVSDHIVKSFKKTGILPLNRMSSNHMNTKRDAQTAIFQTMMIYCTQSTQMDAFPRSAPSSIVNCGAQHQC